MTEAQRIQPPAVDPDRLDRLAEGAVRVGLDLHPGQDLVLTAPKAALPVVRRIAMQGYRAGAGAGLVTPIQSDGKVALARCRNAPDASFDASAGWHCRGMAEAFCEDTARMAPGPRSSPIPQSGCCSATRSRRNRSSQQEQGATCRPNAAAARTVVACRVSS